MAGPFATPFTEPAPALERAAAALDIATAVRADAAGIAARQARRLAQLLDAARRTKRYAALPRAAARAATTTTAQSLAALPPCTKRLLMHDFTARITDPAVTLPSLREFISHPERAGQPYLGRYWAWESSGSSGEPGLYLHDAEAMTIYDALEATRRSSPRPWSRWFDPLYLGERLAFVGATGGHFASHVSLERLRIAWPALTTNWKSLSILQPLPDLVAALNAMQPTILATYPTAASMLAEEAQAGRLRLRLEEVWTGGETLGDSARACVEQAFGCALRNSYGASEFLPIAWECGARRLHVNADWVILEAVDAEGRAVPPGTQSHTTLLTNLANHVQPLIRFDIGDRIVLHDATAAPCPCGCALPVVQVQGRRDDTLVVRGKGSERVPLLPLALTTVLEDEAGAFDFQLQQTAPDALRLVLGPNAARGERARQRCRSALAEFARRQGANALRISVAAMPQLPLGRTGKLKRVVAMTDEAPRRRRRPSR
ncbi:MAG: phenylacetate--CoA ligase family protein [Rubrivivax sp.]